MDEGKGIGSQTHSAGLLPAGFGLARRRTVAPPRPQRRPTPPRPQNQLAQAARAWQRPQNALPSAESARTPRRVRGSHKLCPSPAPHRPLCPFQGQAHCTYIPALSFSKPSLLERRGRGSAPNSMSPCVAWIDGVESDRCDLEPAASPPCAATPSTAAPFATAGRAVDGSCTRNLCPGLTPSGIVTCLLNAPEWATV